MKNLTIIALAAVLSTILFGTGCSTINTSIVKEPQGTYAMTQIKGGPFSLSSRLLRCQPVEETTLSCTQIGR